MGGGVECVNKYYICGMGGEELESLGKWKVGEVREERGVMISKSYIIFGV